MANMMNMYYMNMMNPNLYNSVNLSAFNNNMNPGNNNMMGMNCGLNQGMNNMCNNGMNMNINSLNIGGNGMNMNCNNGMNMNINSLNIGGNGMNMNCNNMNMAMNNNGMNDFNMCNTGTIMPGMNMNNMNMSGNNINIGNIGTNINNLNNMNPMNSMNNLNMTNMGIMNNFGNMNNMCMTNSGINVNNINNMNMSNNGMNINTINNNKNNDKLNINIKLLDGNIVTYPIPLTNTINEVINMLKLKHGLNFQFKLKCSNKALNNSLNLAECGLANNVLIDIEKIEENKDGNNENPQNNNNNTITTTKYSFSRYKKAPQTGLKNLGETSYFNAVLQLFGSIRNLASYFLNPNNENLFISDKEQTPLSYSFHKIFLKLYPYPEKDDREIYKPEEEFNTLGKLSDIYKDKNKKNPIEFIEFYLSQIHKELNKWKKIKTKTDPLNKEKVIKDGTSDFINSNSSIIVNYFYWLEIKSLYCSKCNCIFYRLSNFPTMRLDISGAYQNKESPLTICKILEYQKEKKGNSFCQICKNVVSMKIERNIYSSPNYFIFTLDRGNNNQDLLKIPFTIENNIDISQFLEKKSAPNKFELISIVSISLNENNKYVCFGKSPVDNLWYLYNDENVNGINFEQDLKNNQNYVPCLLAYKSYK